MKTIQLSDSLYVDLDNGDIFIYKYSNNRFSIKEVTNNIVPPIDQYTVEILSFYSKRHFRLRRDGEWYWWEEVKF